MIRQAVQKIMKSLNKTIPPDTIVLPKKLLQELKTKFTDLPQNLADLESEIMNFNAQLSCQGTIKDDVRNENGVFSSHLFYFINEIFFLRLFAYINKRKQI